MQSYLVDHSCELLRDRRKPLNHHCRKGVNMGKSRFYGCAPVLSYHEVNRMFTIPQLLRNVRILKVWNAIYCMFESISHTVKGICGASLDATGCSPRWENNIKNGKCKLPFPITQICGEGSSIKDPCLGKLRQG